MKILGYHPVIVVLSCIATLAFVGVMMFIISQLPYTLEPIIERIVK